MLLTGTETTYMGIYRMDSLILREPHKTDAQRVVLKRDVRYLLQPRFLEYHTCLDRLISSRLGISNYGFNDEHVFFIISGF